MNILWGHIKNIVYAEKIRTLKRIGASIATVTADRIQKTWQERDII